MINDTLILGIGNYLMKDEGIGVHFINYLGQHPLSQPAELLDGGTGGFHLLEYFENYRRVIIIDATLDHHPAGTIQCIKPRYAADFPKAMSTHDIGLKDLVGALQILGKMPEIVLYIVSIDSVQEQGTELNPAIENIMPDLRNRIEKLLQQSGAECYQPALAMKNR
jgi:hydrogenase maturation protease